MKKKKKKPSMRECIIKGKRYDWHKPYRLWACMLRKQEMKKGI